jgi:transposase
MKRKKFSAQVKTQVALEAIKNNSTIEELSQRFGVHPTQIKAWKAAFLANAEKIFTKGKGNEEIDEKHVAELERKVGQQAIEIDFLKKNFMKYSKGNA